MEEISILEVRTSSNAYFFKLANQNWSTTDYCYIETAARRHPDFNVRSHHEANLWNFRTSFRMSEMLVTR